MYEKSVRAHGLMYFQYAPPYATEVELSADKRPKSPFVGAEPWQHSVYYYWWLFLRENAEYVQTCEDAGEGPLAALYQDFGDIREGSFPDWWISRGRELFCEPKRRKVEVFHPARFGRVAKDLEDSDRRRATGHEKVFLEIPLSGLSEDRILEEVRSILRQAQEDAQDVDGGQSEALYPVFRKPVLYTLHKRLLLYRASKTADLTLIDMGLEAGVLSDADMKKSDDAKRQKVSRELKFAKCTVEYTKYGLFPFHKPLADIFSIESLIADRKRRGRLRRQEFESWQQRAGASGIIEMERAAFENLIAASLRGFR